MMEALVCHPLDTVKVRMQLSRRANAPGVSIRRSVNKFNWLTTCQAKPRGFVTTGLDIVRKETALGLYKGLGAVLGGIIPKMAIRFTSYEWYKQMLANKETGHITSKSTFLGTISRREAMSQC